MKVSENTKKAQPKALRKFLKYLAMVLMVVFPLTMASACSSNPGKKPYITSLAELNNESMTIGVAADAGTEVMVTKEFPKAKISYFSEASAAYVAVQQRKIDAFMMGETELEAAIESGLSGVKLLDEHPGEPIISAAALSPKSKIPDIGNKINSFLSKIESNGVKDELKKRWLIERSTTLPAFPVVETSDIHLTVGTTGINAPFSFYIGNKLAGYDVELAYRFAYDIGATIDFKTYSFDGIVTAALSGDIDCIFANLFVTPERQQSIAFSNPTFTAEIGVMVQGPKTKTLDDLKNARIAILEGSNHAEQVNKALPNADTSHRYNTTSDAVAALMSHKVDALALDQPVGRNVHAQYPSIVQVPQLLDNLDFAFMFQKDERGKTLCDELSAYIDELQDDGTIKELQKKWFDAADLSTVEMFDYSSLPATKGTIDAVGIESPPFCFTRGDQLCGYDVELFAKFCEHAGYAFNISNLSLDAVVASVLTGKYDSACGGFTVTEERKESLYFTSATYSGGTALYVLDETAPDSSQNFFEWIADSFDKTFIRENRWTLFLSGIATTLIIVALSIVFGTALGFGLFLLCRKGNKIANGFAKVSVYLIQGMPAVVLLMILYYIIFGSSPISGEAVSVIGFSLIFAAGVFNMLKSGVATVDKGQTEAALALGYRERKTFFRIVLPQAVPHMLPTYMGEIVALIKATAIVGYVAVQDVTKIGDIIRSRTFEPFFPLITVAIIYFLLAALLIFVVRRIENALNPRRRKSKRLLKGVNRE